MNILTGILEGQGLTMFQPMLQLVSDSSEIDPNKLGRMAFVVEFNRDLGLPVDLSSVLLFMVIFLFGKALVQYLAGVYRINVRENFVKRLRMANVGRLNRLAYKYFVASDVGHIQNILTEEVDRVAISFSNYFRRIRVLQKLMELQEI